MALEQELIKSPIVKGAEFRRRTMEGTDKPELRGDDINDQTKPRLLRKLEAFLGFILHLRERISGREKVRVQVFAAVPRISEIADLVRSLEKGARRISDRTSVSCAEAIAVYPHSQPSGPSVRY